MYILTSYKLLPQKPGPVFEYVHDTAERESSTVDPEPEACKQTHESLAHYHAAQHLTPLCTFYLLVRLASIATCGAGKAIHVLGFRCIDSSALTLRWIRTLMFLETSLAIPHSVTSAINTSRCTTTSPQQPRLLVKRW